MNDTTQLTAIVVPLFNGRQAIGMMLESLKWLEHRDDVRLVVVDSGSTDGGPALIRAVAPWAQLLDAPGRAWWTEATDIGCRHAIRHLQVSRLVLLNHDCEMAEADYMAMSRCADDRSADIVCSLVRLLDGRILFGGGLLRRTGMLAIRNYCSDAATPPASGYVSWCGGMGVVVPVPVYTAVGGFDYERFPHYYADADFCFRAKAVGSSVWFCSEACVTNDKSTTGLSVAKESASWSLLRETLLSRKSAVNVRDSVKFYLRHAGIGAPLALLNVYIPHIASSIKRIVRRSTR